MRFRTQALESRAFLEQRGSVYAGLPVSFVPQRAGHSRVPPPSQRVRDDLFRPLVLTGVACYNLRTSFHM